MSEIPSDHTIDHDTNIVAIEPYRRKRSADERLHPEELTDAEYIDLILSGAVHPSSRSQTIAWIIGVTSDTPDDAGWRERYDQFVYGANTLTVEEVITDDVVLHIESILVASKSRAKDFVDHRKVLLRLLELRSIVYVRSDMVALHHDERWMKIIQNILSSMR